MSTDLYLGSGGDAFQSQLQTRDNMISMFVKAVREHDDMKLLMLVHVVELARLRASGATQDEMLALNDEHRRETQAATQAAFEKLMADGKKQR